MLTILPYEVKSFQINKEHKNPYKEICQQKPQKKDTVLYLNVRAPSKERVQAKNYKYKSSKKVKYSRKTKK